MKRLIQLLGLLILLIGTPAFSCALGNFYIIPMNKWWELPFISSRLNLSDQEKKDLNKLLTDTRLKLIDLEADIKKGQFKLENMLEQKDLNETTIMKELEALQKARLEFFKTRFHYTLSVRRILGFKRFETLKEALIMMKPKKRIFKARKKQGHHRHQGKWIK